METLAIIGWSLLGIVSIAIVIIGAFEVGGDLLYFIGNPIARSLGLQDAPTPHPLENKIAKVVETSGERLRVEYQGTTWFAQATDGRESFVNGDEVTVVGRDGLTLLIKKDSS